ncbi:MAG: YbaB/EbfC family nucleoid-associated protein [Pseudomonadota bacterium]
MLKGLGGLGDMAGMMKKAQEMQAKMAEMQEALGEKTVVGEAGAGLVKVTANAKGEVVAVEIDPTILVPEEREVTEDLIVTALKDAQARGKALMAEEMQRLGQDLGLPPGMKLPF